MCNCLGNLCCGINYTFLVYGIICLMVSASFIYDQKNTHFVDKDTSKTCFLTFGIIGILLFIISIFNICRGRNRRQSYKYEAVNDDDYDAFNR